MTDIIAVRPRPTKDIIVSVVIGLILTFTSYFVGLHSGWITHLNWLEVFAVFTSYSCTWLCVKERRINYPIGAVSTIAYAILFWHSGLLASSILNAYLTPQLIVGWFRWRKDTNTRPVTKVAWKWWPVYLVATGAFFVGAVALVHGLGGQMAILDSLVLVLSVLAQWLLDFKKLENWAVWTLVDIIAIFDYAHAGLKLAAVQYVFFLGNTFVGWWYWYKSRKEQNESIRVVDSVAADKRTFALNPIR